MLFRRSLRNKSDYKETSKTEISKIRCQIEIFHSITQDSIEKYHPTTPISISTESSV